MVAGGAQRGEHRGVGNGGAMVAEQTAADNGAHSGVDQRTQLTAGEGVGHGNGDGNADGEGAPGGAGEEGDHRARDEGHRQEQGGGHPALADAQQEVGCAHGLGDGVDAVGQSQNEGGGHDALHALHGGVHQIGHTLEHLADAQLDGHIDHGDDEALQDLHAALGDVGPDGGGYQKNDGDQEVQHDVGLYITVVVLLQLLQLGAHHGNGAVTQQLAGGAGALLCLAHGPEVGEDLQCGEQCDEYHQNRVEVKGDGADVDAHALLVRGHRAAQIRHQTGHIGAPCHEGHQGTHGGAGGVKDKGQLLSGYAHLIRQRTHDHAAQQGAHVVVDGEQADEPGGHLHAAGGFHLAGDHLRKRLDHARLHEERDHDADEYLNEQDPDEVLVAQSLLRQSGEAEGGVMPQQQNAGEAAHEQGKDGVLFPERQSKCKRKGNQ